MDWVSIGAIITAIIGAPILKDITAGYFKRDSARMGDDVAIRDALATRVQTLELSLEKERELHGVTTAKLHELELKYVVLLERFANMERTIEIYRSESAVPAPTNPG